MLRPLTHRSLDHPRIAHGFFTREGGVSGGIYASLNCGVGSKDERAAVLENRARAAAAIGAAANQLATPYQVHGTVTVTVETAWAPGEGPKADALVTNRTGIALGVGAADCGPILFADAEVGVIGAAHAGWRGALAGITNSAIAAMEKLGARRERMVAVLGPSISVANYEVGPDLVAQFAAADPANAAYFTPSKRRGHSMLDLPAYTTARLKAAGIGAASLGLCTYAEPDRFFSYRRATHQGEPDYGRMISVIMLAS